MLEYGIVAVFLRWKVYCKLHFYEFIESIRMTIFSWFSNKSGFYLNIVGDDCFSGIIFFGNSLLNDWVCDGWIRQNDSSNDDYIWNGFQRNGVLSHHLRFEYVYETNFCWRTSLWAFWTVSQISYVSCLIYIIISLLSKRSVSINIIKISNGWVTMGWNNSCIRIFF